MPDEALSGEIPFQLGSLSNLIHLDLSSNRLSGSIPPELGNLYRLQVLYLSTNQLSDVVTAELGNLSNLVELNINNNFLTGTLPASLMDLTELTQLDISTNCFGSADVTLEAFLNNSDPGWFTTQDHCFHGPFGIIFDSAGNLFIANEGDGGDGTFVSQMSVDGSVTTVNNTFFGASGIDFNSLGVLYVSDDTNAVYQMDESGNKTTFIPSRDDMSNPNAIIFDASDNLFVLYASGTLAKYDKHGNPINVNLATGFETPQGMAINDNTVYVSDWKGIIYEIDGMSGVSTVYADTGVPTQGGLARDEFGNLFLASYGEGLVIRVDAVDRHVSICLSGISQPRGLTFDAAGNFILTSYDTGKILKYSSCES